VGRSWNFTLPIQITCDAHNVLRYYIVCNLVLCVKFTDYFFLFYFHVALTYKVLTTSQPDYLHNLISVQSTGIELLVSCHPCSTIRIFLITNHQPLFHICITLSVESALHSVNLILFTVLLVHLVLHMSPHYIHHLRSHHLSLHLPSTPDLKLISFTNPFLHSHSYSFWTAFCSLTVKSDLSYGTLCYCRQLNMSSSSRIRNDWPAVVVFRSSHNHSTTSAAVLKYRDMSDSSRQRLSSLFRQGHTPSSALHCLKTDLLIAHGDEYYKYAADGHYVPSVSVVSLATPKNRLWLGEVSYWNVWNFAKGLKFKTD